MFAGIFFIHVIYSYQEKKAALKNQGCETVT